MEGILKERWKIEESVTNRVQISEWTGNNRFHVRLKLIGVKVGLGGKSFLNRFISGFLPKENPKEILRNFENVKI